MRKKVVKTMVVVACVVAAGMGGFKAYNAANQSEADMLISDNIEALSADEGNSKKVYCYCKTNIFSSNLCSANASGEYCGGDPCSNHDSNCR